MNNTSQLTLVASGSRTWGSGAANNSISSLYNGQRWLSMHTSNFNTTLSLSNTSYWGGLWFRTSGTSIGAASIGPMAARMGNSAALSGRFFEASSTASSYVRDHPFLGLYSASFTTAMPNAVALSDIANTGSGWAQMIPDVRFIASNASGIMGLTF
jgi:hypothetical protein